MSAHRKILSKARRRVAIDRAIRFGAWGLSTGAVAAILLVGIDRVATLLLPWQIFAELSGGGLIAGVILALVSTPSSKQIAVDLDSALHLRDRLGTAEAIDLARMPVHTDPGFAEFARHDADRWAARLDIRSATPITLSRMWGGAIGACLMLAAAILWLPSVSWARSQTPLFPEERLEFNQSQETTAHEIESILDDLRSASDDATGSSASVEDLDALDALAEQLQRKDQSPEDFSRARDSAANQLDQLADELERSVQNDERVIDDLAEQFRSLSQSNERNDDLPTLTDELREALVKEDYERAAELIDEFSQQLDERPEDEQQSSADELRELSDQIENAQEKSNEDVSHVDESIRESLRDQGLDEQSIDDLLANDRPDRSDKSQSPELDNPIERDDQPQSESGEKSSPSENEGPENLARELQDRGVDEKVARDLAEKINRQQQNHDAQREAEKRSQELSDSFEKMADEMERDSRHTSDRDAAEPPPDRNEESEPHPGDAETGEGQQRTVETDEQIPGANRDDPGVPPGDAESVQPQEERERQRMQQQSAADRAKESLRELAKQRNRAEESQQQAERLRESARRMAEQMTPEERSRYEAWARELQNESSENTQPGADRPNRGETPAIVDPNAPDYEAVDDDVDLRHDSDDERTIAEWFDDDRPAGEPARTDEPGGPGVTGRSLPVRDAQRAAERAVSGSSIPKRYHDLIQKYFDRFRDAVENAKEKGD